MSKSQPTLDELRDRLAAHRIALDPRGIAAVILDLANAHGWTQHGDRFVEWLEKLALEMTRQVRET